MQGGVSYIRRDFHIKLQKIMNIATFTYVGLYIVTQAVIIVLTIF